MLSNSFENDYLHFPLVKKNEFYNEWNTLSEGSIPNPCKVFVFFRCIGVYSLFKDLLTTFINQNKRVFMSEKKTLVCLGCEIMKGLRE